MGNKQIRSIDSATDEQALAASQALHRVEDGTQRPAPDELSSSDSPSASSVPASSVPASDSVSEIDAVEMDDPRSISLSEPFVERWSVLISTTNWEKGAIICAWRSELENQSAPVSAYSDEAWSRRVGGVTSQHVGRLRRVYQRFGGSHRTYPKLYWTHFLAALDWDDAEMWLEGASQSGWSVSQMRQTRWQANGGEPDASPSDDAVAAVSIDEDYAPGTEALTRVDEDGPSRTSQDMPEGPRYDGPDFGDDADGSPSAVVDSEAEAEFEDTISSEPLVGPFASLPALPVDLADALEQFKLSIIRHRSSGWEEFSQADMLRTIDALRAFATQ